MWPNALLKHPTAANLKDGNDGFTHSSAHVDTADSAATLLPSFRGLRVRCAINVQHPDDGAYPEANSGAGAGAGLMRKLKSLRMASTGGATLTPEYHGDGVDLLKKVVEVGPGGMIVVTSEIAARILGEKENLNEAITKAVQSDVSGVQNAAQRQVLASPQLVSLGIHELSGVDALGGVPMVELFHLTYAPSLSRRHATWTRTPPSLSSLVQHTPGFYDAPLGEVTIVFIQFTPPEEGASKGQLSKQVFDAYLELAMRCVRSLLLETGGYIIPRRGGRTMAAFAHPLDGARFFEILVNRLRTVVWDDRNIHDDGSTDGFKAVPHAIIMNHNSVEFDTDGGIVSDVNHVQINLSEALPKGMMCSAGLCHGPLAKQMEASGCADYQVGRRSFERRGKNETGKA